MNHKLVTLVLSVAVIGSLLIAGCAPEAAPPEEGAPPPEEEEPAPPAAPEAEVIKWKLVSHTPIGDMFYDIHVTRIVETINEACGGRLVVEAFPGGAIVPLGEESDAVKRGIAEACLTSHGHQRKLFPCGGIFQQTAGGLTGVQRIMWLLQGGGDELIAEAYEEPLNMKSLL